MLSIFSPENIVTSLGTFASLGIILIVFAESGLFFGFFFPGDSLLFTAGFLASQGLLPGIVSTPLLFIGIFCAAVLGDSTGYLFGARVGTKIFSKDDSFFFNKKYPEQAQKFYEKYGKKTIIMARFVPIVRTFAPIVAGVGRMNYATFLTYNIVGGAAWTALLAGGGFLLGQVVPQSEHYISLIVLAIIVISFLPPIWHFMRENYKRKKQKNIVE